MVKQIPEGARVEGDEQQQLEQCRATGEADKWPQALLDEINKRLATPTTSEPDKTPRDEHADEVGDAPDNQAWLKLAQKIAAKNLPANARREGTAVTYDERDATSYRRTYNLRRALLAKGNIATMPMSDASVEFFSVLADVAVKRAKRNGLSYLQDQITSKVCGATLVKTVSPSSLKLEFADGEPDLAEQLLPNTCALLKSNSLERIASEPEVLAAAATADLTEVLVMKVIDAAISPDADGSEKHVQTAKSLLRLTGTIAARSLKTKNASLQLSDVQVILDTVINNYLNGETGANSEHIVIGLGAIVYQIARNKPLSRTNVPELIDKFCSDTGDNPLQCDDGDRVKAIEFTSLAITALSAIDAGGKKADVVERAKATIALVFDVVAATATAENTTEARLLNQLELLLVSSVDRDLPRSMSAAAELMKSVCALAGDQCDQGVNYDIEGLVTLISSIATYSSTYAKAADGGNALSPEEQRKARENALDSAIDAFTDRRHRHGDVVGSIALPVGFSTGGQSLIRGGVGAPELMLPQLSLPLGLAVQRLPGHHRSRQKSSTKKRKRDAFADGFHLMVTIVDLGQFVAYDPQDGVSKPTWSSFLSLGGQIGWLVGSPANSFVIGAEARYAPSLFPDEDQSSAGALRFGLFVGYYISLFDLN